MKTSNFYRRYEIMLKCWQNEPDVRPTFSESKNLLKEMENQHKVGQIERTYWKDSLYSPKLSSSKKFLPNKENKYDE